MARQQPSGEGWRNDYTIEKTVEGGDTLRRISWRVNGGSYQALTVERRGEPAYMMVDHCTAD